MKKGKKRKVIKSTFDCFLNGVPWLFVDNTHNIQTSEISIKRGILLVVYRLESQYHTVSSKKTKQFSGYYLS